MANHQLSKGLNAAIVMAAQAAGTSDTLTATEVDMLGYEGVMFVAHIGTVTSTGVATLTAKNSATSGSYGSGTIDTLLQPISGNTVQAIATTGDSNKLLIIDVFRPPLRYVRAQIVRATANVVIASMVAFKYNATAQATTQAGVAAAGYDSTSNPTPSTI